MARRAAEPVRAVRAIGCRREHVNREFKTAVDAAEAAASALLALRGHPLIDGSDDLADLGDAVAHRVIVDVIGRVFPDDAILSEEGRPLGDAVRPKRIWIVDPLDGTKEYSQRGRADWAVQVAFVVGQTPVIGVVALPALGLLLHSRAVVQAGRRPGPLRLAVSRTRRPPLADAVAEALDADLLPMGSVGAKTAAVIAGDADLYLHAGGQFEWDSAGPVAVARAAGLVATRLDGSPLRYNQSDPYLPDLLIGRPEVVARAHIEVASRLATSTF